MNDCLAPGPMTDLGRFGHLADDLPEDAAGVAVIVQGIMIHDHMTWAYGIRLVQERRATCQSRPVEEMIALLLIRDDRPR